VEAVNALVPNQRRGGAAGRRWRAVVLVAGAAAWAAASRAEDDRAVDDVPGAAQLEQQGRENWIDLGSNFDTNVFQQQGGGFSLSGGRRGNRQRPATPGGEGGDQAESPTLAHLRKLGESRLGRIDAACGLSDAQRRKLRLAMESDIRRLAEEIDLERRKYQGLEVNFGDQAGQRQWQQFQQDVQRCRGRLQTIFDADSLLMKVLPTTLEPVQESRFTAEVAARRALLWKGLVMTALLKFDDIMGLGQKQHDDLERMLLERQPPLRIEGFANRQQNQHLHQMLVWMVLAEVDAKQLRAGLSDRQAALIAQFSAQGKAMRSHVEAQGLLEKVSP